MLKWKLTALLGLGSGSPGSAGDTPSSRRPSGFTNCASTRRSPESATRWPRALRPAPRFYARHGITNVGYWIPQQSVPELGISAENTFIYMRGYPSKEERDKRLKAAHDDPEFAQVVSVQERNPATKLIVKAYNVDMTPHGPYQAVKITK